MLAGITDQALRDRLAPLATATLGLRPAEVAQDLTGWLSVTDGLRRDEVECVLALRHRHPPLARGEPRPFRYPSHFTQLRAHYEASMRDLAQRRDQDRARAGEAEVIARRKAPPAPPAPELAEPWRRALAELRPLAVEAARLFAQWVDCAAVYPIGLDDAGVVLHVPTHLFQSMIAERYAGDLTAALSEALGRPVRALRYQVNGYRHPAAAGMPVAVAS